MSQIKNKQKKILIWSGLVGTLMIFTLGALLVVKMVTGMGPRSLARSTLNIVKAVEDNSSINQNTAGNFDNIIFLHHSVGNHLIEQGSVRELLSQAGYNFWDHDYNWHGLRDSQGDYTGYGYNVPYDNTDPDGLARIFNQREYSAPLNTFSGLLQHDVIITKSCFTTSNITSEDQLEQKKSWYLEMRDKMDEHPEKVFILVTQPPLNPAETNSEEAARVRMLANWLKSPEFLDGHPNVFTFDFYTKLAEENPNASDYNMLRQDFRNGSDSHPNKLANEAIAPLFVDFVIDTIEFYRSSYQNSAIDTVKNNP